MRPHVTSPSRTTHPQVVCAPSVPSNFSYFVAVEMRQHITSPRRTTHLQVDCPPSVPPTFLTFVAAGPAPTSSTPIKRGRGRPKGSKNKIKSEPALPKKRGRPLKVCHHTPGFLVAHLSCRGQRTRRQRSHQPNESGGALENSSQKPGKSRTFLPFTYPHDSMAEHFGQNNLHAK